MKYEFISDLDKKEYDEFVSTSSLKSIYQLSNWAKVKNDWEHYFIGVKKDGILKAGGLLLFRKLPLGLKMGYMPRGPIVDPNDSDLMQFMFKELKSFCLKKKAIVLKFDPNIRLGSFDIHDKQEAQNARNESLVHCFESCNARYLGYELDMTKNIQPRFQLCFSVDENWNNKFPSKTMKKIESSFKKGVIITQEDVNHVHEFAEMIHFTEKRKGIALRNENYFRTMMEAYKNHSTILTARIQHSLIYAELEKKINELDDQIKKLPDGAPKRLKQLETQKNHLFDEIAAVKKDWDEDGDCVLISALILIDDGTTVELLYSGLNEKYRRYLSAYALRYKGIEYAYQKGCTRFNFGGVQGSLEDALFTFKSSFNPDIDVYLGEFDYPCMNLIYPLWAKCLPEAKKLMKKLRQKK